MPSRRLRKTSRHSSKAAQSSAAAKRSSHSSGNDVAHENSRRSNGKVEIAGVMLSSPDRVLYRDQGITKEQLARYYEAIADWALPN